MIGRLRSGILQDPLVVGVGLQTHSSQRVRALYEPGPLSAIAASRRLRAPALLEPGPPAPAVLNTAFQHRQVFPAGKPRTPRSREASDHRNRKVC